MPHLRPLDPADTATLRLVAQRMGATLDEVIGDDPAHPRPSRAWLEDRVRHHLDPDRCEGTVLLLWPDEGGPPVAHCILRREDDGPPTGGVFATIWVHPGHRRQGLGATLLDAGEAWMRARGMVRARTDTATTNTKLRRLLADRGYRVVERAPDGSMVRLARPLAAEAEAETERDHADEHGDEVMEHDRLG